MLKKLINSFGYSNFVNKKKLQKSRDTFIEMSKYSSDTHLKILTNFRAGHMNMIAGMIAFLGLIYTTDLIEVDEIKIAFLLLLYFILFSTLAILISFYTDVCNISRSVKRIGKYVEESSKSIQKIQKLEFDKQDGKKYNEDFKQIKFTELKFTKIISNFLYILAWICLILGLGIICYYFTLDILR